MKKTLAALAVLGAFAGSAAAADVTLYGLVDYGFAYQHLEGDVPGFDEADTFRMNSGMNSGSRFGLRGTEDLGNGLTVGFVLENGFDADSGELTTDGHIFDREAQVYVKGGFGTFSMGRVGQLASGNGSYGLLSKVSPFSSGWGDTVGMKYVMATGFGRMDNTVTYVTPDFAGFRVHAQYSFQNTSGDGEEGESSANRYYGAALTWEAENAYFVGIVDSINYGDNSIIAGENQPEDDQLTVTLGAAYDFGIMKLFGAAQYFDNAYAVGQKCVTGDEMFKGGYTFGSLGGAEGYGVALGMSAPVFGGTFKAHAGYMEAEAVNDGKYELNRWNVAAGYDYNLSKRTSVYSAVAYTADDASDYNGVADPSSVEVMAGLIHRF